MKCVRPCCRKEIPDGASFLSVVREEAVGSRPAAKKKAPPPNGHRHSVPLCMEVDL